MLWRRDAAGWRGVWRTWWPALLVVVASVAVLAVALWWFGRPLDTNPGGEGTTTDLVSPSPTATQTG